MAREGVRAVSPCPYVRGRGSPHRRPAPTRVRPALARPSLAAAQVSRSTRSRLCLISKPVGRCHRTRLACSVHLHGSEALLFAAFCTFDDRTRSVASDPAVDLEAIAHLPAQQLPDGHAQSLALDVPQSDVESGCCRLGWRSTTYVRTCMNDELP